MLIFSLGAYDRRFSKVFNERLWNIGRAYIYDNVWKFVYTNVEREASELAIQAAREYACAVHMQHCFTYCLDLSDSVTDEIFGFAVNGFEELSKIHNDPGFRSDDMRVKKYLQRVEGLCVELYNESIRIMCSCAVVDSRRKLEEFRKQVCMAQEEKIEVESSAIAETEKSMGRISDGLRRLHQMKNQLKSAVDRHKELIRHTTRS